MSIDQIPNHAAHTGAALSIGSWIVGLLASAEPVISAICGIVGIISGGFAIAFYVKRLRE